MTKCYEISRADLKRGAYRKVTLVQKSGTLPAKREIALLVQVLKKATQK